MQDFNDLLKILRMFFKPAVFVTKGMFKLSRRIRWFVSICFVGMMLFGVVVELDSTPEGEAIAAVLGAIFWTVIIIYFVRKITKNKKRQRQAQTLQPPTLPLHSLTPIGVMFGKKDGYFITKPETLDGHVLVVGGVGSGKSSCVAVPSLRAWEQSVFAIDIKGELYEQTKDFRPNIHVFNPLDPDSYGYDPFFCLRTTHNPAQEARAIAQAIIPLPPDTREPFWIENAQNVFSAAILHFSAQDLSFLDTVKQIQSTPPKLLIQQLCDSSESEVRYFVNSLADMEDKTLSSIMSELSKNIVHFVTDKNLISALSREKNISPNDLEFGNDIYINIPEHLLRQWKTLLTLIVNQFLTHFEQRSESNARPILFLLDEFPRLGKVETLLDGLATLRSKKIVICLCHFSN
ncbi:MAG: type IV secretory system conjugative DNA transfer family protein [Lachnoclostridium sp.]|nr:type IV secretory system conjugative DNA transfer family protein [Lachnoclostridium sp.]